MDILAWLREQKAYLEKHPKIMEEVIDEQGRHTLELPTMGGAVFWDTVQIGEWKFQRHITADVCRILDGCNDALAYGTQEEFYQCFRHRISGQRQRGIVRQKKYGIVLSGGGGKGAYEIGVWRYLHERGMDSKITGIAGTSVGALNGLLFLQGSYDIAENVWLNLKQETMFSGSFLDRLAKAGREAAPLVRRAALSAFIPAPLGLFAAAVSHPEPVSLPVSAFPLEALTRRGIFNQDGIEALIRRSIDWDKVKGSKKLLYCTVATAELLDPAVEYRCLNGLDKEEIINSVLQSASIPVFYGPRKETQGNKHYVDGGTADNTPVRPLLLDGYEELIVIHLSPKNDENEEKWQQPLDGLRYNKQSLHHIWPSDAFWEDFGDDTLGNARAIITVNPKVNRKRMDIGYADACKQLAKLKL